MATNTYLGTGNWGVGTSWSLGAPPTNADDVVLGSFTVTIEAGVAAQAKTITMTGTSTVILSKIVISSTASLTMSGNISAANFNEISLLGNAFLDLGVNQIIYSGTQNTIRMQGNVDDYAVIKGTTGSAIYGTAGAVAQGKFICQYFLIQTIGLFYFGCSFNVGRDYELRDGVWYNNGYIQTDVFQNIASNFVVQRVDFIDSQTVAANTEFARFCPRTSGGTTTGLRIFDSVTVNISNKTTPRVRLWYFDFNITNCVSTNTYFEVLNNTAGIKYLNCFFNLTAGGNQQLGDQTGMMFDACYVYAERDNPHTMENSGNVIKNGVLDIYYPPGSLDGGDHFICKSGYSLTLDKMIVIDRRGGVGINALGSTITSSQTMTHCTFITDVVDPVYGVVARNETGGKFGGTTTLYSNLAYVRSNPSGAANIRAINIETAGADQIDIMDYNAYYGYGPTQAVRLFQVVSSTKTIGDNDYGMHDVLNVNPNFVDDTRDMAKWQLVVNGSGGATEAKANLLAINGYDSTSKQQRVANKSGKTVLGLLNWVQAGYSPTSLVYKDAGKDGVTIGAVEYTAAASGSSGLTFAGLTSAGLTRAGLTSSGLN